MQRILIVEDATEQVRLQAALRTARPELRVSAVPSAEEALLEATRLVFDVLVTDLRLPGMTGVELIRKLRQRQPGVRVMVLTGLPPDDPLVCRSRDAAPDCLLCKPVTAADFLQALSGLLETEGEASSSAVSGALTAGLDSLLPTEDQPEDNAAVQPGQHTAVDLPVPQSLPDFLHRLRGVLEATAVLLMDENGQTVEQLGDLPAQWAVIPTLRTVLSASVEVSRLLGETTPGMVQMVRGKQFDLALAAVGQFCLLTVLPPIRSTQRIAHVLAEIDQTCLQIADMRAAPAQTVLEAVDAGEPEPSGETDGEDSDPPLLFDAALQELEQLLETPNTGLQQLQDPDVFWQTASEESSGIVLPGVMSFDQARKLGIFAWQESGD